MSMNRKKPEGQAPLLTLLQGGRRRKWKELTEEEQQAEMEGIPMVGGWDEKGNHYLRLAKPGETPTMYF